MTSQKDGASHAHLAGLSQCKRIWDCPVCAANIAGERRNELGELIKAHGEAGGSVYMTALTVPHGRFDDLKALRFTVSTIWRKVQAGKAWRDAKLKLGLVGTVRALEVTHGKNGWHPHLHLLFFFPATAGEKTIERFGRWLFKRWARYVRDADQGECNENVYQFERARSSEQAGAYVTKWGSEWEMLGAQGKTGKNGNKTPWQLLHEAADGDQPAGELFVRYSKGMKGARQLTYSKGLRQAYKLAEALPDSELDIEAGPNGANAGTPLGYLSGHAMQALDRKGLILSLLEAVEEEPSWNTVFGFLLSHGIPIDFICRRSSGPRFDDIAA